jgi:hypothetical protein
VDYLRTDVEPLDLWEDQVSRGIAKSIVSKDRIDTIASDEETKPFVHHLHLFLNGEPNMYQPPGVA